MPATTSARKDTGRLRDSIKREVSKAVPPTLAQFRAYQAAWDYFNRVLFKGELRPCLLVFRDGRPVKNGVVHVIEVNPRASRTIPFVSKTTGVPLARLAAAVMAGRKLGEMGLVDDPIQPYVAVKEAVFPFAKFPGVDVRLGPEMKSTGEVMGIAESFGMAFAKAQASVDGTLPLEGTVFVTVNDHDKATVIPIAPSSWARCPTRSRPRP